MEVVEGLSHHPDELACEEHVIFSGRFGHSQQ